MGKRDIVPKLKEVYGASWPYLMIPVQIEMAMVRFGGYYKTKTRGVIGKGLRFHLKELISNLWPELKWHKWNELILDNWIEHKIIGIMGPASSGKTCMAAVLGLADFYCWADQTTVLCTSTEKDQLDMKLFGEMKSFHKRARAKYDWIPGEVIEYKQRIITDKRYEESDGRDFRLGIAGVPCKRGGSYVGLGSFVGTKNKRVRLLADEGNLMPRVFVDAISNLAKNPDFKCLVMGNPMGIDNGLAMVCEPAASLGGWDGGIDQTGGTKVWPTRFPEGVCIQIVGSETPNAGFERGEEPYPFLIKDSDIKRDEEFYGKDSWQYMAMDEGRMPRGQGARRVITRQLCEKNNAKDEPTWVGTPRKSIGFADIAYGNTGGDRCVFGELQFGMGMDKNNRESMLMALIATLVVPVKNDEDMLPEDQIALFIKEQCERRVIDPKQFFFDSTGRGSMMNAFGRLWSPYVQGIEFGGKPSKRQVSADITATCDNHYFNFVSELWWSARLVIEAGQFRGMTEEVMQEGCGREWMIVSKNKVQVEPKKDMKVKMGRSPDLFDALVCGIEGARRNGFIIKRLSNFSQREADHTWKRKLQERALEVSAPMLDYSA